jgi:hypothetical protein
VFLKGRQALKGITIKKLMMHKVPQITSRAFHRRLRRQQSTHTHTAVARKPLPLMYTTGASVAFRLVSGTYSGGRRVISARVCVCLCVPRKNLWRREGGKKEIARCSPTGDLSIIGLCRLHHAHAGEKNKKEASIPQHPSSDQRRPTSQSIAIMFHLKLKRAPPTDQTWWDRCVVESRGQKDIQTYIGELYRKKRTLLYI